ncbi:Phytanoyl-dioxygenase family protein [Mycena indigotica]|uniref:Phytanoyl-dioxygenase family protein n=1 Tax=Mycena indigotica TaxID=2126181 RepID=A0A8H6WEP1_9AGAR|nr:Phytanoyl-dioxygenase family protein [Mycena indigotica]KAF7315899.1 Phytanoyl-dioxygenase family protein [Mycena indigotica]
MIPALTTFTMTSTTTLALREKLNEDGFVIVPGLVTPSNFSHLKAACSDVVRRTREGSWSHRRTVGKQFPPYGDANPDSWGVQHVMHPELGQSSSIFAGWYTSQEVVDAVQMLLGCEEQDLQMELFNLLINPLEHDFALRWHRDDIPDNATPEEEKYALDAWKAYGIQWNTALYVDSCLFVVPGSHKIPRTPEQRRLSCVMDAPTNPLDMPGAVRLTLQPGESVFYNSNILHCAAYSSASTRATLHATMGTTAGGALRARNILQHGLGWMKERRFAETLDDRGKEMLGRLLKLYDSVPVDEVGYSLSG